MRTGLTANRSLLVPQLLEHAGVQSAGAEVIAADDGVAHRSSFRHLHRRASRLAGALTAIGVRSGDTVASIAWNDHRHIELYFAVTGLGATLHTIDPHLGTAEIVTAIVGAGTRFVCFDGRDAALYERVVTLSDRVVGMISMATTDAHAQDRRVLDYERLLAEHEHEREWAFIEENALASLASMPGAPQRLVGATHRMTALQAVAACADDAIGLEERDNVLLAVPFFLPGAWSLACAVAISGANLVLPGANFRSTAQLFQLMCDEQVTLALAPPDAWSALLDFLDAGHPDPMRALSLRCVVACGEGLNPSIRARLVNAFGPDIVCLRSFPPDEGGSSASACVDDPSGTA